MSNMKRKTINGMVWTVTERLSLQAVHMLISIVLARLLEPSEFGLVGMLAIFTSVAQSLLDSGFGSALIQKKNATQTDATSIFYFNLFVGILLAGILSLAAPLIADFYQQPTLIPLTRALSLSMVINAFGLVQLSLMNKNLEFKRHFSVSISAVILSGVAGIVAALSGLGVWSLVIQTLSHSLVRSILLWIFNKWRPTQHFSFSALKSMYSFGSKLLVAGLIETTFKNIYQTFIGKEYSATDLGYYSRASTIEQAATVATSMSLGRVIFPAFSPYQDDHKVLKQVFRKTIRLSMFLHIPLMMGLIAVADPLFRFLLTDKWGDSIPYFQLLCVVGLLYPIQVQNYNLFRIKGRSDLHLKLEIVKYMITAIAIALTYKSGITALLLGQIATAVISNSLNSFFVGKLIDYRLFEQLRDLIPSFLVALFMGFCVYLFGLLGIDSHLIMLILQITAAVVIYYLINKIIKSNELRELMAIITDLWNEFSVKLKGV